MNQGNVSVVALATWAGMTGVRVWPWLCSASVGGPRPLPTVGMPLFANLR